MRRFDESYTQVKDLLDSGEFGAPLYLRCSHWFPEVDDGFTTEMAVYDAAIHEIDVIHWLLNERYESAQVMFPRQTGNKNPELKDPQIMHIRCKSGVIATIEVFLNCQFGYDISCQIVCENGVIDLPKPPRPLLRRSGGQTIPLMKTGKTIVARL